MPLCCVALAENDSGKVGWGRAGGVLKRSKSGKRNTVAILEGHPVHSLFNSLKSSGSAPQSYAHPFRKVAFKKIKQNPATVRFFSKLFTAISSESNTSFQISIVVPAVLKCADCVVCSSVLVANEFVLQGLQI